MNKTLLSILVLFCAYPAAATLRPCLPATFSDVDANDDGLISHAEFYNYYSSRYSDEYILELLIVLDKNVDGSLTSFEYYHYCV